MLNAEEARKLAEIERKMVLADPALARRLANGPLARRALGRRVIAIVLAVLSVLLEVTSLVASSSELALTGLCVFSIALVVYLAGRRLSSRPR